MKALLFPIIILLVCGIFSCSEKTTQPFAETVSAPTFSIESGLYLPQQIVSLNSSTSDAVIRYTVDGTTPGKSSVLYAAPIQLNSSQTIKAIAYKKDWNQSSVSTGEFQIFEGNPDFYAHLTNMTATPDSLYADGGATASQISVMVTDIDNVGIAGQLVTFETSLGTILPTATTNANGFATTTLRADVTAGTAHVMARINVYHPDYPDFLVLADSESVDVRILPVPVVSPEVHSIVFVSPSDINMNVLNTGNDSAQLRVKLLDAQGELVTESQDVWFKIVNPIIPLGASINNQPQSDSVLAVSDNGYASVNIFSGTLTGVLVIKASVTTENNYISVLQTDIRIFAGPAHQIVINSGGYNSGLNVGGGLWSIIVSAQAQDVYGNPCEYGTSVYFSIPDNPYNYQINATSYIGNESTTGEITAGVAYTTLTYSGIYSNESTVIRATMGGVGGNDVTSEIDTVLPMNQPQLEIEVTPGEIVFHGNNNPIPASATAFVNASVFDIQGNPIHNVRIALTSNHGVFQYVVGTNEDPLNSNEQATPNIIVTDWYDALAVGYTDVNDGQDGLAQGMILFYAWEVPLGDPQTNTPGMVEAIVSGHLLGTEAEADSTIMLRRFPI